MDSSLSNFELSESKINIDSSESGSDKSEPIEIVGYGDEELEESKPSQAEEEKFDNNLPNTVTLLKHKPTNAKVYLVGTAHFSKESQEDVRKVISNVKPNIVMLELCASRTRLLELDEKTVLEEAKNIDMSKMISILKSNGTINGLMYILLLNISAHFTRQIGMAPGGEFRVAYKEASNIPNTLVVLGDRPIHITMKRAFSRLSWFQTLKLAWFGLLASKDPISVEDIEQCKNRDILEKLIENLAGEYPGLREVFLAERDVYLTCSLQKAAKMKPKFNSGETVQGPIKIVGVVGIGHTPGIIKLWDQDQMQYIEEISKIPRETLTSKVIKFAFKTSMYGLLGLVLYRLIRIPKIFRNSIDYLLFNIVNSMQVCRNPKFFINN